MMKKTIINFVLSFLLLTIALPLSAIDTVTLTTFGDGTTKQEAINNALRAAIEQTYGAFMFSTTVVENDLLISDEIISVSNGNINSYKILGGVQNADGTCSVSCEVVVSLQKLHEYVLGTGAQVEFRGDAFGANVKLEELNKASEKKALDQLVAVLSSIDDICDYDIKIEEPDINEAYKTGFCTIHGKVLLKVNDNTINYGVLLYNTLASLNVDDPTREDLHEVPNLGRFTLRNPLPDVLSKDLNEYKVSSEFKRNCDIRHWEYQSYAKLHYDEYLFFKKLWNFNIFEIRNDDQLRSRGMIGKLCLYWDNKTNGSAQNYTPYPCLPSVKKHKIYESYANQHQFNRGMDLEKVADQLNDQNKIKIPVYPLSNAWSDRLSTPLFYPFISIPYSEQYGAFTVDYAKPGDVFAQIEFTLEYDTEEISKIKGWEVQAKK